MNTIVTKFGGSSLADSIHFKKVKNIIEGNSENMVRRRTYTLDHSAISGYGVP